MSRDGIGRTTAVAWTTLRASFTGTRAIGLAGVALLFPLLVAGLASAHLAHLDLPGTAETLFSSLFLPILLLLVTLVLGVGLFRTELEEDTLVYAMSRSVPRPALVVGKYAGLLGAGLLLLVPSVVLSDALATGLGPGPNASTAPALSALLTMTVLAVAAYGALFLFLGLLTRQALVIGLLIGFIWETFVPLLPGPLKVVTVIYYLRTVGARLVDTGPLSVAPSGLSLGVAAVVLAAFSAAVLAIAGALLRYVESRPGAAPS
ncbi:MAG TPA: hypothetical protein VGV64_06880 [Thermoplasmata archaeon]|nr:hypothetical protein [Thermoplasmata archaeon]